MICPFKVGDRVRNKHNGQEVTVTKVTHNTFEWKLDKPIIVISRLGYSYDGGMCYEKGFSHYTKVK